MTALVGRAVELAWLADCFESAVAGLSVIVHLTGPAGIGKSALVREFLSLCDPSAAQFLAVGDELELAIPGGVVAQLAGSTPERPKLLERLATTGELTDAVAIGGELLQVFTRSAGDTPSVVLIDDAHWADQHSLQAIGFAIRRLREDPVLVLLVTRSESRAEMSPLLQRIIGAAGVETLALGGLALSAIDELARGVSGLEPTRQLVTAVHDYTNGNPLYARSLLEEYSQQAFEIGLGTLPLPAPAFFAGQVLNTFHALSDDERAATSALAVLGIGAARDQIASVLGSAVDTEMITRLVDSNLVQVTPADATLSFRHPLIRSAIYHDLDDAQRRAMHERAAIAVNDFATSLQHRLAAASGPNAELATQLRELGHIQLRDGALAAAYDSYVASARVDVDEDRREISMLDALECLLALGDVATAQSFAERIARFKDFHRRTYAEGCLALVNGSNVLCEARLARVADDEQAPSWLRARAAAQLAPYFVNEGRSSEAVLVAQLAGSFDEIELPPWALISTALYVGLAQSGRATEALERSRTIERTVGCSRGTLDALVGRGIVRKWVDDLAGSRADLGFVYEESRRAGPLPTALVSLFHLAEAEYRSGLWDASIGHADLAVSLADDAGQAWILGLAHAVAAMPLAGRGLVAAAAEHVVAAQQYAAAFEDGASAVWAATAAALLARCQGEHDGVVRILSPLRDMEHVDGLNEPGIQPWRELLAEAFVRVGSYAEAESVLGVVEALARQRGRQSSLLGAARVRGQLERARNDNDAAETAFADGYRLTTGLAQPFEIAMFELTYGRFLRRSRRRREAGSLLRSARDRLRALGAVPYLVDVDRELEPLGSRNGARTRGSVELTPQELAVANLVSSGRTNREVAQELTVSVKTVEYHLGKIFAKLNVSTRTQLGAVLRDERAPVAREESAQFGDPDLNLRP